MKDFDEWNIKKKEIEQFQKRVTPQVGEIWMCSFGYNLGFEIDGKENFERPALILSSFFENGAIVIPLTSKSKIEKFNYFIGDRGFVNLTQIRFIDSKRLYRMIDQIDKELINNIKQKFIKILA